MRRYKIREKAYKRVHAWLKAQKAGAGKVLGAGEMPADYLPHIAWAHGSPLSLVKAAHGKEVVYVREHGTLKRVLHSNEVDAYLREALLSPSSDVGMRGTTSCRNGP